MGDSDSPLGPGNHSHRENHSRPGRKKHIGSMLEVIVPRNFPGKSLRDWCDSVRAETCQFQF